MNFDGYTINSFLVAENNNKQISQIKTDKNFKKIIQYNIINELTDEQVKKIHTSIVKTIIEKENLKIQNIEIEKGNGEIKIICKDIWKITGIIG